MREREREILLFTNNFLLCNHRQLFISSSMLSCSTFRYSRALTSVEHSRRVAVTDEEMV